MTDRMARFLIALYPRRWRERYGREFLEFLQERPLSISAICNVTGSALYQRFLAFGHRRSLFSRYTEAARRAFVLARHQAMQNGSSIETEHFLFGVLREDGNRLSRFFANSSAVEAMLEELSATVPIHNTITISRIIPPSSECERILMHSQEEAEGLGDCIGVEHFLLGILREENSTASKILKKYGLEFTVLRDRVSNSPRTRRNRFRWLHRRP